MKRLCFILVIVMLGSSCGKAPQTKHDPVFSENPRGHASVEPIERSTVPNVYQSVEEEDLSERFVEAPFLMLDEKENRGPRDLVIVAVGDVQQAAKQWPEKTNELKEKVLDPTREILGTGDLTFMNLENPISENPPNAKKTYAFTSPPERLDWYLDAHFNLFSLANNHSADAGQKGIDDTIKHITERAEAKQKTVIYAGTGKTPEEAIEPKFFKPEGKDLTVAFFALGFSKSKNVARFWDDTLPERIADAKTKADIVLVSVHAGREYNHVPQPNDMKLYRGYIDAGADAVIGHHTHCVQPVEHYKDGIIFYSLGNFVFSSRTVRHRKFGAKLYGLMARIVFQDGKLRGAQLVPTWVNNSEAWKHESGEVLPNANFTPQILTGVFAEEFFKDFSKWSKKAGTTDPEVIGDTGFIRITPSLPDVALRF